MPNAKKNPARPRRERINKDWPIKVQTYDCWPQKIPKDLWDCVHAMRRLWNDFTAIFKHALTADKKDEEGKPLLSKDERRAVWAPLDTKQLREVAKGYSEQLDSYCREAVVVNFTTTVGQWRKNPKLYGPPRFQCASEMDHLRIPLNFNTGVSAEAVINNKVSTVSTSYTQPFKKEAPELYLNNGHFCVGINRARIDLHIAYGGRSGKQKYFLPEDCRIKQISLCGRKDSAFGWSWSLQFRLEHPPGPPREATGRVCGWDSAGWRLIGDRDRGRIRIGVIADNAGHFYEIAIPLRIALNRRQRREKEHCEKNGWIYDKPETWKDLADKDSCYGKKVEECKSKVREIYEQEKEKWPVKARRMMGGFPGGFPKMRDTGLRGLRRLLERETFQSEAIGVIARWEGNSLLLNQTIRAFEAHATRAKENAFREIAVLLDNFDIIAWEADLSLKQMAEQAGEKKQKRKEAHAETGEWDERTPAERQLEASQKFRQIVGQHRLRQFVKEKHAARLQNERAAYSTQICPECDGYVEPGRKLLLVCENGHKRDQDVAASLYFLSKIEGAASIPAPPLAIPDHLRPYLRVMDASEVRLEVIDKQ